MSSSSRARFEVDPRTGIAAARVDPDDLIADPNPIFEEILATDPADLDLEVRGDPALFQEVQPGAGHPTALSSRGI
jgi:hypothetical protein